MAKKDSKRPAEKRKGKSGKKVAAAQRGSGGRGRSRSGKSAAEALRGLLESPLVADTLAAGAAAAFASFSQRGTAQRARGAESSSAIKKAAKAAGAAMGARLTGEIDTILKTAKKSKREAR